MLILSLFEIVYVFGCNYARSTDYYYPLDTCFSYPDYEFSYYHTCYGSQLFDIEYSSLDCMGVPSYNQTTTRADYFNCGDAASCDSVHYTVYAPDFYVNCNDLRTASYNKARIINKCVYLPSHGYYKIHTCTETLWSTSYYADSDCTSFLAGSQYTNDCEQYHGSSTYVEITQCTKPLNEIGKKCGFVQWGKQGIPEVLNHCHIYKEYGYSYMYTCLNNMPYYYEYWTSNCNALRPDYNGTIKPMSYSCSSNQCNYVQLETHHNNNCTNTYSTNTLQTIENVITNECFNWFDSTNTLKSTKYYCDDHGYNVKLTKSMYNGSDYDASSTISVKDYVEHCSTNNQSRYFIQCHNSTYSTPSTTIFQTTITTVNQTSPLPPTTETEKLFYVSKTGADAYGCGTSLENACGTMFYASAYAFNSSSEIFVQGQNPYDIEYWTSVLDVNPCVPFPLSYTSYDKLVITFDPKHIHSREDWYYTELCEARISALAHATISTDTWKHSPFYSSIKDGRDSSLTINNMIFGSYTFDATSYYNLGVMQTLLICNNCVFYNITINSSNHNVNNYSAIFIGPDLQFYDCKFENISYVPSSRQYTDEYGYDFSFIKMDLAYINDQSNMVQSLIFQGSTVTQIDMLHAFIHTIPTYSLTKSVADAYGTLVNISYHNISIFVQDCNFVSISVVDAIIYHEPDSVDVANIDIYNTNFFELNLGSILYVAPQAITNIYNVNITTSQTIPEYLSTMALIERYGHDYYSLFVFESATDNANFNNVNIKYEYASYISDHCVPDTTVEWHQNVDYWIGDFGLWQFTYYCKIPFQFLESFSTVSIINLSLETDLNNDIIASFRDYIMGEIFAIDTAAKNKIIYVDFVFDSYLEEYISY